MKDSILKGTGNSRFLKSEVPAGTSWADALAMLQAGTFPIDFNGINAEGFQQVGTPLNKANLLKDATAAQIGLPPSTTPNDMFNVLAHAGDLHVWRKTVVNGSPVSAYFSLGDTIELTDPIIYLGDDSEASAYFEFSNKALTVRDNGTVDNNDDVFANVRFTRYVDNDNKTFYPHNNASHEVYLSSFRGRYVRFYAVSPYFNEPSSVEFGVWYYVPADATTDISRSSQIIRNNGIIISKLQKVIGHPYQPAGTTVTYPVSTNRNAYQEGDDAKPAGYVVGEVVTSKVKLGYSSSSSGMFYYYADMLSVNDAGEVSISTQNSYQVNRNSSTSNLKTAMAGKFIQLYGSSGSAMELSGPFSTIPGEIVFIPADTSFNTETIRGDNYFTIDRYQPVTGYAAIPAGTTIEYLGCLGDKARVQFGSYVGTGTYGESNQNTLNLSFTPRFLLVMDGDRMESHGSYANFALFVYGVANGITVGPSSANYEIPLYATWNKNSVSWYNIYDNYGSYAQMNHSGTKYRYVAIG